jgi:uridine phosphorylase
MNMSEQDESQSKWLRRVADQLYEQQREYSIANTCEEAADAFDALSARCAEMEAALRMIAAYGPFRSDEAWTIVRATARATAQAALASQESKT